MACVVYSLSGMKKLSVHIAFALGDKKHYVYIVSVLGNEKNVYESVRGPKSMGKRKLRTYDGLKA